MLKELCIDHFLVHSDKRMTLSPGVNLITGANGSGKTTLLQAIVWALWGFKARASDQPCSVRLLTSQGPLWRRVTRSELVDFGLLANSNKTKALPLIESHFGTFQSWKRTLWITGKNVSAFSSATAKGRWDHLVSIVGAEVFDAATTSIKDTLQERQRGVDKLTARSALDENDLYVAKARLYDLTESNEVLSGGPDTAKALAKVEALDKELAELDCRIASAKSAADRAKYAEQLTLAQSKVQEARDVLKALPQSTCFVCGQPTASEERQSLEQSLETAKEALAALTDQMAAAVETVKKLQQEYYLRSRDKEVLLAKLEMAQLSEQRFLDWEKGLYADTVKFFRMDAKLAATRQKVLVAEREHAVQSAALDIIKSAKRKFISSFCAEIERLANRYMQAIGTGIRLQLALQDGALEIVTTGTGAGSYENCSSGEQRRIDICLLLAMSQVAASVGNLTGSAPLVIDEALDTLDEVGVEALLLLACDIARSRQVILVSHVLPALPQQALIHHIPLT